MKFKNRIKRLADILEKLGVAGLAIWLFRSNTQQQEMNEILLVSTLSLIVSTILTKED